MKKDVESRIRKIMQKLNRTGDSDSSYTIQHMDTERLAAALIGTKGVTQRDVERIRRFAIEATLNPNAPIADEFKTLPFVREYMKKRES